MEQKSEAERLIAEQAEKETKDRARAILEGALLESGFTPDDAYDQITAPMDWNIDAIHGAQDWRGFVPEVVRQLWEVFPLDTRAAILVTAAFHAENW